jgi:hypothetical protein
MRALFFLSLSLLIVINISEAKIPFKTHDGYIVKFKEINVQAISELDENLKELLDNENIISTYLNLNAVVVKEFSKELLFQKNLSEIIEYIEPNYLYFHPTANPSSTDDHSIKSQWALEKIQAEEALEILQESEQKMRPVVAIIDSGIDYNHPDLKDNIWKNTKELYGTPGVDDDQNGYIDDIYGMNFTDNAGSPLDNDGHGTHCAGVIGAVHNDIGVRGVIPKVSLMGLKFISEHGVGSAASAASAIKYAINNGAQIISNSWGGPFNSQTISDAVKLAEEKNILFVAAAGNSKSDTPFYPASLPYKNVVSVAASDKNDFLEKLSNFGLPHVKISAPGSKIISTFYDGRYISYSGTSMATPHISGAAALLLAYKPNLRVNEIVSRILKSSTYLPNFENFIETSGRLNLLNLITKKIPLRPKRPSGDEKGWITNEVNVETPHRYGSNQKYLFKIDVPPTARYLKIHFKKFHSEFGRDTLKIIINDQPVKSLSGKLGEDFSIGPFYVENTEYLELFFKTDMMTNYYGFLIDSIHYLNHID